MPIRKKFRDPPAIFLFWTNTLAAVHHRFKGVKINSAYPFGSNIHEWTVPKSQQKETLIQQLKIP